MKRRAPLKRTGFAGRVYVAPPPAPVRPVENCRGTYARNADAVVATPKEAPLRSEEYRRYVATLPCFACGIEGYSQAAHPNVNKGLGLKTDDRLCFPLCATRPGHMGHHMEHDLCLGMTRDERRELETRYTASMQRIARAAGRKEFAASLATEGTA